MFGFIAYAILSVIMSIVYTMTIVKDTDLRCFCRTTRIWFTIYFIAANIFAWPVYAIYIASYLLHDHKN